MNTDSLKRYASLERRYSKLKALFSVVNDRSQRQSQLIPKVLTISLNLKESNPEAYAEIQAAWREYVE